jgi:hypothetical protein
MRVEAPPGRIYYRLDLHEVDARGRAPGGGGLADGGCVVEWPHGPAIADVLTKTNCRAVGSALEKFLSSDLFDGRRTTQVMLRI